MARVGGVWLATDGQCTVHTLLQCILVYCIVLLQYGSIVLYCSVMHGYSLDAAQSKCSVQLGDSILRNLSLSNCCVVLVLC